MVSNTPFNPFRLRQAAALPQRPRRPPALALRRGSWRTSAAPPSRSSIPLVLLFTTNATVALLGRDRDGDLPRLHHLDVPARGAAGVERLLRASSRCSSSSATRSRDGYGICDFSAAAGCCRSIFARPAVLPDPRQPAPRPGVLPALDAAVRRQLGLGHLGVRSPAARSGSTSSPSPPRTRSTSCSGRCELRARRRRDHDADDAGLARDAQPGPRPLLAAAHGTSTTSTATRSARASSSATPIVGWNFGDGHLHDERLIAAVQRRLNFAPGELVVAFVESQPIHKNAPQAYRVIDAALGVVERGTWNVARRVERAAVAAQRADPADCRVDAAGLRPGSVDAHESGRS